MLYNLTIALLDTVLSGWASIMHVYTAIILIVSENNLKTHRTGFLQT